jgi:DNA polymerase III epsilon subunit-like protein
MALPCGQYVAWDTETTGIPKTRVRPIRENLSKFDDARIVSLSAVKFSSRGREIDTFNRIIKPIGYQVGATHIHGITHEYAEEHGVPFKTAFQEFIEFIGDRCNILCAHNSLFDEGIIGHELLRIGLDPNKDFLDKYIFNCTHEMYKKRFLSSIKLTNLYRDIFGKEFDNAHNSLADARACGQVYPYLMGNTKRELKPLPIKKVIIGASAVASAIGINQYKRPQELVEELWKKYSPQTFEGKTKEEEALLVLNSLETTKKILNEAESFKSETSTDVQQETRKLFHQIEHSGLLPQQMVQAKEHIRKTLYTKHGTRNEQKTAQTDKMAANLVEDDTFYKYDITTIEGTLYQIVGRLDRIQNNEDGTRTLVEIKNRTRGLFNRVRDYEEVQCLAYLEMLEDIEYCRLVETYEGESKSYLIQRDHYKWKTEILPKLTNFCEHFHSLLSSA